jgi:hypothetical protein
MELCVSIMQDTKIAQGLCQSQHSLREENIQDMAVCYCENQVELMNNFLFFQKFTS